MLWRLLTLPFRVLMLMPKGALVTLLVLLVALEVSTVTSDGIFRRVSALVGVVNGGRSVQSRQDAALAAETARANSEGARADTAVSASSDLKAHIQSLTQDKEALTGANAALKQQNAELSQANAALTADSQALKVEAAKAKVLYLGQTMPVADAVSQGAQRVVDRAVALASRGISNAQGQAMPFLGVAAISRSVGEEIDETCDLMKELQTLNLAFNPQAKIFDSGLCGFKAPTVEELWTGVRDHADEVWKRTVAHFDGLQTVALPGWWATVIGWADTDLMPQFGSRATQ